jgi:uncharacterized SAM-binding protein YcdF (DUF218 family)
MSASWIITNTVSALLLPPLNMVVSGVAGFMMRKRWPRIGGTLCVGSLIALIALSTGAGAKLIVAPLENMAMPLSPARASGAQAIVVLGGGRMKNAPEYDNQDIPSMAALARLRYGAKLHRETGLPILVTGGSPDGSQVSEAQIMARVLREDFATPVKWLEQASDNTAQNAQFSARLLAGQNVQRILLVTDAIHMPRSQKIFLQNGLQVVPAPTTFLSREPLSLIDFVPGGDALGLSHYAMHEWLGLCWYWLRYRQ